MRWISEAERFVVHYAEKTDPEGHSIFQTHHQLK